MANSENIAFVNVNVIPMDAEHVLENQTVIVRGDRIAEIGPADEVTLPPGAPIIEGNSVYLMPGLADMHTHLDNHNQDLLSLYLANGVTTVRNFNSDPLILSLRDRVAAGELLGPTLWVGRHIFGVPPFFVPLFSRFDWALGPMFEMNLSGMFDNLASNPAEGREVVRRIKEAGYDFIKINWFLTRETFDSITATAGELELPLTAHIPADVGIEHLIRSGVEPQHDYQLLAFLAKDYVRRPGANPLDMFDLSEADEKMPKLEALLVEAGVPFTPTLLVYHILNILFDDIEDLTQAPLYQQSEYRYVPPEYMRKWTDSNNPEFQVVMRARGASEIQDIIPDHSFRDSTLNVSKQMVKALYNAGVPILAGTDSSDMGIVWGFSIHQEIELFVEAGLTPYQALETATRIPAEVVGNPEEWGTVEVGKRADLLLLSANPLDNINHTRHIEGTMVRGRWLPQAELRGMLDEILVAYEARFNIDFEPNK